MSDWFGGFKEIRSHNFYLIFINHRIKESIRNIFHFIAKLSFFGSYKIVGRLLLFQSLLDGIPILLFIYLWMEKGMH